METIHVKFDELTAMASQQNIHNHEDSSLTSSIGIEAHEAPPIVTTSEEQTSLIFDGGLMNSIEKDTQQQLDGNMLLTPDDAEYFLKRNSFQTNPIPIKYAEFHQVETLNTHLDKSTSFGTNFPDDVYRLKKALYGLKRCSFYEHGMITIFFSDWNTILLKVLFNQDFVYTTYGETY
ncbi:hypothetical protein Tco_0676025 [Tanacetum coccineum]